MSSLHPLHGSLGIQIMNSTINTNQQCDGEVRNKEVTHLRGEVCFWRWNMLVLLLSDPLTDTPCTNTRWLWDTWLMRLAVSKNAWKRHKEGMLKGYHIFSFECWWLLMQRRRGLLVQYLCGFRLDSWEPLGSPCSWLSCCCTCRPRCHFLHLSPSDVPGRC